MARRSSPSVAVLLTSAAIAAVALVLVAGRIAAPTRSAFAQPAPARWTLVPEVRIGSETAGPTYQFSSVGMMTAARDNSAYVVDPVGQQVRVFDAAGKFVRAVGRKGQGPGEFARISALGFIGDTLYVVDDQAKRTSFFRQNGTYLSSIPWVAQGVPIPFYSIAPDVVLRDGTTLDWPGVQTDPVIAGKVPNLPILHLTAGGRLIDTLAWVPFMKYVVLNGLPYPLPYSANSPLAYSSAMRRLVIGDGKVATSATNATFRVTVLQTPHDTVFSRTYPYVPRRFPAEEGERIIQAIRTSPAFGGVPVGTLRATVTLPAFRPPVSGVLIGDDSTTWVLREDGDATLEWMVLGPRGDEVGTVMVRSAVSLLRVSGTSAWAAERDSLDVPTLVRYRIRRP